MPSSPARKRFARTCDPQLAVELRRARCPECLLNVGCQRAPLNAWMLVTHSIETGDLDGELYCPGSRLLLPASSKDCNDCGVTILSGSFWSSDVHACAYCAVRLIGGGVWHASETVLREASRKIEIGEARRQAHLNAPQPEHRPGAALLEAAN